MPQWLNKEECWTISAWDDKTDKTEWDIKVERKKEDDDADRTNRRIRFNAWLDSEKDFVYDETVKYIDVQKYFKNKYGIDL